MTIAVIIFIIWFVSFAYAKIRIEHIPRAFKKVHSKEKRRKLIAAYSRALFVIKLTKLIETLLKVALIVVPLFVPGGVILSVIILIGYLSIKRSNFRGYNGYKERERRYMTGLDNWIVVANQTILNN